MGKIGTKDLKVFVFIDIVLGIVVYSQPKALRASLNKVQINPCGKNTL